MPKKRKAGTEVPKTPPPDKDKPYVYVDGEWHLIAVDSRRADEAYQ